MEGHPLLEPVWSSGASDSASSSALGEDDLSQVCRGKGGLYFYAGIFNPNGQCSICVKVIVFACLATQPCS